MIAMKNWPICGLEPTDCITSHLVYLCAPQYLIDSPPLINWVALLTNRFNKASGKVFAVIKNIAEVDFIRVCLLNWGTSDSTVHYSWKEIPSNISVFVILQLQMQRTFLSHSTCETFLDSWWSRPVCSQRWFQSLFQAEHSSSIFAASPIHLWPPSE